MTDINKNAAFISLPAEVNIKNAATVKSLLDTALSSQLPGNVDTSSVQSVDTAGVQLLLAYASHCGVRGVSPWKGTPSELILGFCESVGIDPVLLSR
jgi:anti-anti-sigma regulatory factor